MFQRQTFVTRLKQRYLIVLFNTTRKRERSWTLVERVFTTIDKTVVLAKPGLNFLIFPRIQYPCFPTGNTMSWKNIGIVWAVHSVR